MEETVKNSDRGISFCNLKRIACISMIIDHATYVFIPENDVNGWMGVSVPYLIGRCLGRTAFILFAFLLVEGFFHTSSLKKYILRMAIAAVISEPAFDLMCGRLNLKSFLVLQNILFTFTLSLIFMGLLEMVKERFGYSQELSSKIKYNVLAALICVGGFVSAYFFRIDYGVVGIGLVFVFYFLRGSRKLYLVLAVFVWSLVCIALKYELEWAGLIALIPICMYHGEKGKGSKWFFYIFYPAHMLILGLIRVLIL